MRSTRSRVTRCPAVAASETMETESSVQKVRPQAPSMPGTGFSGVLEATTSIRTRGCPFRSRSVAASAAGLVRREVVTYRSAR